jgi:hypothetical protein
VLAIAYVIDQPAPWSEGAEEIFQRFTTNPTFAPFKLGEVLAAHHLFEPLGERATEPISMQQTVDDYISGHHARSSLSLDAMTAENALRFDAEMQALLVPFAHEGVLTLSVAGGITWGRPTSQHGSES